MKIKKSIIFLFIILIILIILGITTNFYLPKEDGDYKGELAQSKPQNLSIFVLPPIPIITIISPENETYSSTTILLNYSAINADAIWYNLDNGENITITSSLYFTTSEGSHTLYLYANNSEGISVKNVTFSVHIPSQPNGGGKGGGGGGNGKTNDTGGEDCQESWVCDSWTACLNSSQQRTCEDINQCNETYTKTETRTCKPEGPEVPQDKEKPKKSLLFYYILTIILIILIILIISIIKKRKIRELIKRLYKNKKRRKNTVLKN